MKIIFRVLLLISQLLTSIGFAEVKLSTWNTKNRAVYIKSNLRAVQNTSSKKLGLAKNYFKKSSSSQCRSSIKSLKLQCLMKSMNDYCNKLGKSKKGKLIKDCLLYADILIVNKLSQNRHLSHKERFFLLKKMGSYSKNLDYALVEKYAAIAMDFSLSSQLKCLTSNQDCFAEGMDRFCIAYSDEGKLPWQSCVGALIWFIGFSR